MILPCKIPVVTVIFAKIALFFFIFSACSSKENANFIYHEGNRYLRAENYAEAFKLFDKAILLNDTFELAYLNRGICFAELNNDEAALKDFYKVLAINPQNSNAYNNIGLILLDRKEHQKAIAYFDTAIVYNPKNAKAYFNRGEALYELEDDKCLTKAINDLNKAIECGFDKPRAYYVLAKSYFAIGFIDETLKNLQITLEKDENFHQAYLFRGFIETKLLQKDKACLDFRRAKALGNKEADKYLQEFCN